MSEQIANHGPSPKSEPYLKGGGSRGGPRRWTGAGPRPARHVPWPELFKHHESNLTGHLKMMNMIRKHCVEGTGNWQTAMACIERTRKMLSDFRMLKRNFVPPRDSIDRVPLGASSASVYPGYSPADHIYGEAAQEYGQQAAEARKEGIDFELDPQGPEYVVGQTSKAKKEQLLKVSERIRSAKKKQGISNQIEETETVADREDAEIRGEPMEGIVESRPMFYIDSNPTPVALKTSTQIEKSEKTTKKEKKKKRKNSQEADKTAQVNGASKGPGAKNAKTSSETVPSTTDGDSSQKQKKDGNKKRSAADKGDDQEEEAIQSERLYKKTKTVDEPVIEEDDIEAEVEARLKAKEEKRRRKEEKKRKRDSGDSVVPILRESGEASTELQDLSAEEKPKKKKTKMEQTGSDAGLVENEGVDAGNESDAAKVVEKTKKKEKKEKKRRSDGEKTEATEVEAEAEVEVSVDTDAKGKNKKRKMKKDD